MRIVVDFMRISTLSELPDFLNRKGGNFFSFSQNYFLCKGRVVTMNVFDAPHKSGVGKKDSCSWVRTKPRPHGVLLSVKIRSSSMDR